MRPGNGVWEEASKEGNLDKEVLWELRKEMIQRRQGSHWGQINPSNDLNQRGLWPCKGRPLRNFSSIADSERL